jgi:hypothetical protein
MQPPKQRKRTKTTIKEIFTDAELEVLTEARVIANKAQSERMMGNQYTKGKRMPSSGTNGIRFKAGNKMGMEKWFTPGHQPWNKRPMHDNPEVEMKRDLRRAKTNASFATRKKAKDVVQTK